MTSVTGVADLGSDKTTPGIDPIACAPGETAVVTRGTAARAATSGLTTGAATFESDVATGVGNATAVGWDTPTSGSDVPPVATAAADPVASVSCLVTAATCFSTIVVTFKIITGTPDGRTGSALLESVRGSDEAVSAV